MCITCECSSGFLSDAGVDGLVHRFLREHQAGGREQRERLPHDSIQDSPVRQRCSKRGPTRGDVHSSRLTWGTNGMLRVLSCCYAAGVRAGRQQGAGCAGMDGRAARTHGARCPTRWCGFMGSPPWHAWSARWIRWRHRVSTGRPSLRCSMFPAALSASARPRCCRWRSFSGLWKYVVPAALKCDPGSGLDGAEPAGEGAAWMPNARAPTPRWAGPTDC